MYMSVHRIHALQNTLKLRMLQSVVVHSNKPPGNLSYFAIGSS